MESIAYLSKKRKKSLTIHHCCGHVLDNDDSVLTNEKDALKRCRIEFEMKEQASNQSFLLLLQYSKGRYMCQRKNDMKKEYC